MTRKIPYMLICLTGLLATGQAAAEGPWVYEAGASTIGAGYVHDSYDEIWMGKNKTSFNKITQQTLWLYYDRGLSSQLMMSVQTGYTKIKNANPSSSEDSGLADSTVSLKYQWLNEFADNSPVSISSRMGLILKGSYDRSSANNPQASGDKANGVEVAAQLGKFISNNVALFGDLGYRFLDQQVPDEIFYSIGGNAEVTDRLSVSLQYAAKASQTGLDIGGKGFSGEKDLYKVKEERNWLEFGVSVAVGNRSNISAGIANVLDGRNTGDSSIWNLNYTYTL